MRKLTKIIVPALCATMALGAALPAQAYPTQGRNQSIASQIDELQRAVNRSDRRDRISGRDAWNLRRDVQQLSRQYRLYSRNGLSRAEYRILDKRIDSIRARLHVKRHDRDRHRR
ncbi:MAG: hypothetical protein H6917_17595 [Novosphingobium sp.]|nr:hypothetical protein [Novosphingobium sp.]MCP5404190.1 hypothetical protein [Novosphingobium sp.]